MIYQRARLQWRNKRFWTVRQLNAALPEDPPWTLDYTVEYRKNFDEAEKEKARDDDPDIRARRLKRERLIKDQLTVLLAR